jgi:hypothetical protein
MKKALVLCAFVALLSAPSLFAADLSIGGDVALGMTSWDGGGTTTTGVLPAVEFVVNAMFSPQVAGEFKLGLMWDLWEDSGINFTDKYVDFVGLFKFYVNPTVFVGAGFEYIYFLGSTWEAGGDSIDWDRSDYDPEDFYDAGFIVVAVGADLIVSPQLVVPLAANLGYGMINMPDSVTRMHIYATVGLRYLL